MSAHGDLHNEELRRELEYVGRDMKEPIGQAFAGFMLKAIAVILAFACLAFYLDSLEDHYRDHGKGGATWKTNNQQPR